jgi:hypothetical protein
MGYAGEMEKFDQYLEQNPDKQREMIVYQGKAQEMARGGMVRRFAVGGMPSYVNPINTGGVGAAVMSYGYNPTTNQYSISGGGGQSFPEGFESSMDAGALYKKYPQIKGSFEAGVPASIPGGEYDPNNSFDNPKFGDAGFNRQNVEPMGNVPIINSRDPVDFQKSELERVKSTLPPQSYDQEYKRLYGMLPQNNMPIREISPPATPVVSDSIAPQPTALPLPQQSLEQSYVPTTGIGEGQIPVYGTEAAPSNIQNATATLAQTGAIPVGAVTQPQLTSTTQEQLIGEQKGQLSGTPVAPTYGADTSQAATPTTVTSTAMDAAQASPEVQSAIQANQAAQTDATDAKAQVVAAQQTATSVANLTAAQGNAILLDNPVTRQIQTGELIDGVADAEKASAYTEQVQAATSTPSEQATVAGQLASLTANFDATNPPAWAAGALRGVQAMMQQRGIGASSMAGQAMVQAALESALPIAQADAQVTAQFEAQNLSNRQARAMLSAQQRATFMGMEFDQDFQSRVQNSAKIADIANRNFTADQAIALENSRNANTVNLNNLSNKQALTMSEAAALAQMDGANLNARQQAAVQNAGNFLQIDMANLTNEQQTGLFNAQAINQSLLTDQAATNASRQFNATSQNQVDQFMANLGNQVSQFNATQNNAQNQFNAGELNTLSRFNAEVANQRDQFNAQNQLAIAQNNAVWRREIATADTAAVNRANELNAKAVLDISNTQYDNLWNFYSDTMEWAWRSAEGEQDRNTELAKANIDADSRAKVAAENAGAKGSSAIGSLIGTLGSAYITGSFGTGCWVAREVYGEYNPQWFMFRLWMKKRAPTWFYNLYWAYGERFASFISNKPKFKKVIRYFMNKVHI